MSFEMNDPRAIRILYTNYKGETRHRFIIPSDLYYGSNEWHKGEQWILPAIDLEKNELREFALKDIKEWTPISEISTNKSK